MKADTVLTAIIAVCCVFAIGATSTTLDSTVSTDPEDVTKVEYEKLPIGKGDAQKLDEALDGDESASGEAGGSPSEKGTPSAASDSAESGDRTGSDSGSGEEQPAERSGRGEQTKQEQSSGSGEKTRQERSSGSGQETDSGGGANPGSGNSQTLAEPTLLERLLFLLRDLLDALLKALPYAVLLAALGAAVRYRDRLLSRVAPTSADGGTGATDFEPNPENEVASAWFEMVERLDLADRRHLTPREYAEAARRRGVDADAVRRLTALFEEVRYGGARVTEERRRRAEKSIRQVRTQLEGR